MSHLLAVFLLAINTLTTSALRCPAESANFPCECRSSPREIVNAPDYVSCNIASVASVRDNLARYFTSIPRLVLTNLHSTPLATSALGGVQVQILEIRDSPISRIKIDAFVGQTSLEVLRLEYCRLEEVEDIQNLASLTTLSLTGNFLPKIHDRSLTNLTNLEHLTLSGNHINAIYENALPRNLETLVLTRNQLLRFNGSLRSLPYLKEVYASHNKIYSLEGEFNGRSGLKKLSLHHNQFNNISGQFSNLTSLEFLNLARNWIRYVGNALDGLRKLKVLILANNLISIYGSGMFETMLDLHHLDLSGNTPYNICATLTRPNVGSEVPNPMRTLKLSRMNLTTLEWDCFAHMRNLNSLDLSGNNLTTLQSEIDTNFKLTYLDISSNRFVSLETIRLPETNENPVVLEMGGNNTWRCPNSKMKLFLRDMEGRGYSFHGHPRC